MLDRRLLLCCAPLAVLGGCASAERGATGAELARAQPAPPAWRLLITSSDRERLRDWRNAWMDGLQQARTGGSSDAIAHEGVLLDPDAALPDPQPPDGDYRCRVIKLGHKDAARATYVAYPAFTCRVGAGRLTKLGGSQRPSGLLWPLDGSRLLFLGAMALGDEAGTLDYGRDAERDLVGVVERIAARRWRLVLPRPHWESQIDVIELVPAAGR